MSGGSEQAILLVGHGSHLNARSSAPVFAHAATVRDRADVAEVREAFWKEEPSLRNALRTVASDEVFVVPVFTSEGYFTGEVLPRDLRLADGYDLDVDKTVRYTAPVGTHESMTDVVVRRAETVTGDPDVGPGVGVAVVGHGTERNEKSAHATLAHVDRLRESGRFDEVRALFLDEDPRVENLTDLFDTDDVVVVPMFVADGYHTTTDIPDEIGLTAAPDGEFDAPQTVDGVRVWYAGAVGTEPLVADVVLERVAEARDGDGGRIVRRPDAADASNVGPDLADARDAFLAWVDDAPAREWGEAVILGGRDDGGRYELRHRADVDADATDLDRFDDPAAAERVARYDEFERYRPLKGAPSLRTGWTIESLDGRGLVRAVSYLYPASVANWHRDRTGTLDVTHFRETAARQTGIYAEVADLDAAEVESLAAAACDGCIKRREWDERGDDPLSAPRGDGEIPCREACSFLVAAARELHREEWDDDDGSKCAAADDESTNGDAASLRSLIRAAGELDRRVPEGKVADAANPYRIRYRRALAERTGDGADELHRPDRA